MIPYQETNKWQEYSLYFLGFERCPICLKDTHYRTVQDMRIKYCICGYSCEAGSVIE